MRAGKTEIVVKRGDITKEEVDAIVTAANSTLSSGGGVDAAIHKAGGPAIMAELKQIIAQIKKLPPGETVITAAGKLKAKHIVHAVGPVWSGGKKHEAETLENAYYNSLMMAKEYGAETIAFPAISTGSYAYPLDQAAEIALKTIREFCETYESFNEVRLVLFTDEAHAAFQKAATAIS